MAKKTVAKGSRGGAKAYTKVVKAVKTEKGSYIFREEVVPKDQVDEYLKKN